MGRQKINRIKIERRGCNINMLPSFFLLVINKNKINALYLLIRLGFLFIPVVLHLDMKASRLFHLRYFLHTRFQCRGLLIGKIDYRKKWSS